jgi:diguanylate cyclase (GGDEF)-like protein/PAS domain S-box-containing protein
MTSTHEPGLGVSAASTRLDILGSLPAVVWEADVDTEAMLYVSERARDITGFDPAVWVAEPKFWEHHLHPDDLLDAGRATQQAIDRSETVRIEYRFKVADGTYRWFQDSIQVTQDGEGRRRLVGVMVDVHDQRSRLEGAQKARAAAAEPDAATAEVTPPLHQAIVDNLSDGVYYVDRERRISYWNRGAERLSGYAADQAVGKHCYDNLLVHIDAEGRNLCKTACPLMQTIADGKERSHLVWLKHALGHRVPVEVRTGPIRSPETNEIVGGVEIFSDASGLVEARDAVEAARQDALTDPMTGLPSRRLLDAVLPARQDDLDRHRQPFGFLLVEIDDFAEFARSFTDMAADQALRVVGATIKGSLRTGDLAVRWGDASFAVVAAQVDADGIYFLAERLLRLVRATIVPVPMGIAQVRVSIGGALGHPLESGDVLTARTEAALAAAQTSGKDRFLLNEPLAARAEPRQFGVRW